MLRQAEDTVTGLLTHYHGACWCMAPHDTSSAPGVADERRHTILHMNGERHGSPPQPSSASASSDSLPAQDRQQNGDVAKGLGSMKRRLMKRLTFSESQLSKDALSGQPGMRVALDCLCYTVRNASITAGRAIHPPLCSLMVDMDSSFLAQPTSN